MVDLLSEAGGKGDEFAHTVSPYLEMGAYEALWEQDWATFRRLARSIRHGAMM